MVHWHKSHAVCRCMLNAAARLVVGTGKFDHVTPILHDVPHWLRMPQRIQFKVALTAFEFDCVCSCGPAYFRCIPVANICSQLKVEVLLLPQIRTQLGCRSFHVVAPVIWNALPAYRRSTSISRGQFRVGLVTVWSLHGWESKCHRWCQLEEVLFAGAPILLGCTVHSVLSSPTPYPFIPSSLTQPFPVALPLKTS